jgi:hypothetical protein
LARQRWAVQRDEVKTTRLSEGGIVLPGEGAMADYEMTTLHAAVLWWFDGHGAAPAEEAAAALDLPVAVVEELCGELEEAGLIEPAPWQ